MYVKKRGTLSSPLTGSSTGSKASDAAKAHWPTSFELEAYPIIQEKCKQQHGLEIYYSEPASKVENMTPERVGALGLGQKYENYLKESAATVGKGGTLVDLKYVEFDFVGYVVEPQGESQTTAISHESSPAGSPDPVPLGRQEKTVKQCLEEIVARNLVEGGAGSSLEISPIVAKLALATPSYSDPQLEYAFLRPAVFQLFPPQIQEALLESCKTAADAPSFFQKMTEISDQLTDPKILSLFDALGRATTREKPASKRKEDSPESETRKVVLWEIKENAAVSYLLAQLELRVVAYQKRRARKQKSEQDIDCIACVGVHVRSEAIKRELLIELEHNLDSLKKLSKFANKGCFVVTTAPERKTPLSSATLLAAENSLQLAEYWVSVTGVLTVKTDVSTTLRNEGLNHHVDGLKEAVLKKFSNKLQGKDVSDITVYAPGSGEALDPTKDIQSVPGSQPYHVEVK